MTKTEHKTGQEQQPGKAALLFVATALDIGGVQRSLLSLLESLPKERFDISLMLLRQEGQLLSHLPGHVRLLAFPAPWALLPKQGIGKAFFASLGWNLNALRFLYRLAEGVLTGQTERARQRLLHDALPTLPQVKGSYQAAIDYTGGYKSFVLSKVQAQQTMSWLHGDYRTFQRDNALDTQDYARLDHIVAVSPTCRQIFAQVFPKYQSKTRVMHNIVNKQLITRLSHQQVDFDEGYTGTRVLDITRLDPDKGLSLAIEACRLLKQKGRELRWYILGEGPERQRLEAMIAKAGLTEDFVLLGSHDNPYPFIRRADFVVHCSLFEGRSVAMDEAMLLQKPVVLTNFPTAGDQVEDGVNGLICGMDAHNVAASIERLLDEPALAQRLKDNLAEYDLDMQGSLDIFYQLVSGQPQSTDEGGAV